MKQRTIKLLRSDKLTETNQAVAPDSNVLEHGELAINYAKGNETLFIKNNTNEVVNFKSSDYIEKLITDTANTLSTNIINLDYKVTGVADSLDGKVDDSELAAYAKTSTLNSHTSKNGSTSAAGHVKVINGDLNGQTYVVGEAAAAAHTHSNYVTESDLSGYAKTSDLGNYVTESDLSGYAKTSDLNSYVKTTTLNSHTSSTGSTSTAGHVKIINGDLNGKTYVAGEAAAAAHTHSNYAPSSHSHDDMYYTETEIDSKLQPIKNDIQTLFAQSPNVSQSKVLWLGTSIPYGDGDNNYPKMVADGLGFTLYNNSRAGSFVSYYPNTPSWTTSAQVEAEFATGFSLSATKQETRDKYYNLLNTIRRNEGLGTAWRDNWITQFQSHSYEELIIPYIDGTKADCDIVIIDHGFNDRDNIFNVCSQHPVPSQDIISYWPADQVGGATNIEYPVVGGNTGWYWLTHLSDNRYYDGEVYMNTLRALGAQNNGGMKGEYFGAMAYVIEQIRKVNPRIRIVIGNYFSLDHGFDSMSSFVTKYILEANEQIAKYNGFQCVNVYQYTGLRNYSFTSNDGVTTTDMIRFCPDGVHPASDTTGQSNRFIANVYMKELRDSMIY